MKNKNVALTLWIQGMILLTLFSGCKEDAPVQSGDKAASTAAQPVATFPLQKEKLSTALQLPGELVAFQQVDLYAKISSFVKDLKVDIGSEVLPGQLLATLEAPELASQLAAAQSRLKSQEAVYTGSKSNYDRLVETSKTAGTVSQNDIDMAEAKKSSDFAQLEAARAYHKEITTMIGYLEIRAPFGGVISARNVNPGAYVGPSGKGSELPLFTLQEQKHLRLALSVPEAYTSYLRHEDEVSFRVKSLPGEIFHAKVKRMSGALDSRLRSERIEMDVINTSKRLLPGMVAEVNIALPARDSSFVVPKTALVSSAEGIYVIRSTQNKAERVPVKKGREAGDKTEIFGDLEVGDPMILKASEEIRNGADLATGGQTK